MSIYGPIITNQTQNKEVNLSAYPKKTDVLLKAGGIMRGNIDMTEQRIVHLGDPVHCQDAASKQYVDNYATFLQNNKVDYSGGTMTGNLNMGDNKIINVGDPENETDAVNKKYVDEREREQEPYDIGRYIVFPQNNGDKIYFSVRTKKNIDLVNDLSFGMINTGEGDDLFDFINGDHRYDFFRGLGRSFTLTSTNISKPWTMLFSSKPETNSRFFISCSQTNRTLRYVNIQWGSGFLEYTISDDYSEIQNSTIRLDTTKFNHVALECLGNKIFIWINGESKQMLDVDLGGILNAEINPGELKILCIYHRNLSKHEIAEHFVEYQVKGSANNKVLI